MALRAVPQMAMDEVVITDPEIEQALEKRQVQKDALGRVRAVYEEADDEAQALLGRLELPVGGQPARVGRFRIAKAMSKPRSVQFETGPKVRTRIQLVGEED